VKESYQYSSPQ